MTKDTERAREQARAQLASIVEMVAALECDYDRLDELREERGAINLAIAESAQDSNERELYLMELCKWDSENLEELTSLNDDAGDCESEEDARERIQEDALSVEVRADWHELTNDPVSPDEFQILLCTGGPAVRIIGELDEHLQPSRAWIEYQDWGTPWTELVEFSDAILTYCQVFYFGE